jgi:hypothetical protein
MPDHGIQTSIDEYHLMNQVGSVLEEVDGNSFDKLDTEPLGQRDVAVIEENEVASDLPEERLVVKYQPEGERIDENQNARAVANYIEAYERGYDFFPRVYGGKYDLSIVVMEHLDTQTDGKDVHQEWKEIGLTEGERNVRGEVLTEWGARGEYKVPIDLGQIIPEFKDDYNHVEEPSDIEDASDLPNCHISGFKGSEYFATII